MTTVSAGSDDLPSGSNNEEVVLQEGEEKKEEQAIPLSGEPLSSFQESLVQQVTMSEEHQFDVATLPEDLQRLHTHLKETSGEEYALVFVFAVRTAVELHRAWHLTLLTTRLLQQIKDKFGLRMTWHLGVIALTIRVDDVGGVELHRKVPYDYDAEFQDFYIKLPQRSSMDILTFTRP